HFTAKDSSTREKYKGKPAPSYDGEEYLLIDGYNVIFSWDELRKLSEDNIEGARQKLVNILCNFQGYKKCEVILVFDAYKVKGDREVEKVDNINIVYTKEAETADMYIEKVSHKLAKNNRVRVVTSDGMEQLIILAGGALRVSSRAFLEEVEEAEAEIRKIINET
ncbi:MAG: NYN domain-containing protein, partial [Ruminococcus sp.]|nr:NYN domain-containing protein [Ruminococcus sp.]